jgi:hypothetical protein
LRGQGRGRGSARQAPEKIDPAAARSGRPDRAAARAQRVGEGGIGGVAGRFPIRCRIRWWFSRPRRGGADGGARGGGSGVAGRDWPSAAAFGGSCELVPLN